MLVSFSSVCFVALSLYELLLINRFKSHDEDRYDEIPQRTTKPQRVKTHYNELKFKYGRARARSEAKQARGCPVHDVSERSGAERAL